jgi:hypothetical protein
MLCVDHCREGRIEWETEGNGYLYVESGDVQIDSRGHHVRNFCFPLSPTIVTDASLLKDNS